MVVLARPLHAALRCAALLRFSPAVGRAGQATYAHFTPASVPMMQRVGQARMMCAGTPGQQTVVDQCR